MSKKSLRQQLLNQRRQLDASSCDRYSRAVQAHVLGASVYAGAETIALYAAVHNEVQTDQLFDAALNGGKRVCFPRLESERIIFVEVDAADQLQAGRFGVLEPQGDRTVPPDELEMVLVPGVGFSLQGGRIGYGLGYYDRALAQCVHAEFLGLAYAFQLVEELPEEEHDIRLDYLATESGIIEFQHKRIT